MPSVSSLTSPSTPLIAPSPAASSTSVASASSVSSLSVAQTVLVRLKQGAHKVLKPRRFGIQSDPAPSLRFHNPTDAAVYEAIFPKGIAPPRGAQAVQMAKTLGRLVEKAEKVPGAVALRVGVHGVSAEPGAVLLASENDPDVAPIIALLRSLEVSPPSPPPAPLAAPAPQPSPAAPAVLGAGLRAAAPDKKLDEAKVAFERAGQAINRLKQVQNALRDPQLTPIALERLKKDLVSPSYNAGVFLNRAAHALRGRGDTLSGRQLLKQVALRRAELILQTNTLTPLPADQAAAALRQCAFVLRSEGSNVDAYRLRGYIRRAAGSADNGLEDFLNALQAFQKIKHPSDPPASLSEMPWYEDATSSLYRDIADVLPSEASPQMRAQLTAHLTALKQVERRRNDPKLSNGAAITGPMGGSARSPRDMLRGATQLYTISSRDGATVGSGALAKTLDVLHNATVARGFNQEDGSCTERVCGFNSLVIRRDAIEAEDFDGVIHTTAAAGAPAWIADLCGRIPIGQSVTVLPQTQSVRSDVAECYKKFSAVWGLSKCEIALGDSAYRLAVGTQALPDTAARRRVAAAAVRTIAAARDICNELMLDSESFATCEVGAEGVQITAQFTDIKATPEVRAATRTWLAAYGTHGLDALDISHLQGQIRDYTEVPTLTLTEAGAASEKARIACAAMLAEFAAVSADLAGTTLKITVPEPPTPTPRSFNKSGYKLWNPTSAFRLVNQELYLRDLGHLSGWADQFEAKLMRELGINVRIWQPVDGRFRTGKSNDLVLQEDAATAPSGPTVDVMRLGEVHYVTLDAAEFDAENPSRATAKRYIDNPGGGDCFFYAALRGAQNNCPESLPETVRAAMGGNKGNAPKAAVLALRASLQKLLMHKLDTSVTFEDELNSHLTCDNQLDYMR